MGEDVSERRFVCRVCGGTDYSEPFLACLFECTTCSTVFHDPQKFTKMNLGIGCSHVWREQSDKSLLCPKCGEKR